MAKQEYILKVVLDDGELKVKIPGVVKSTDDLSKAFDKASTSSKKFTQAAKENKKVNEDLIKDSGLAGATLTELGRTISDLPFGIRGVANNLSQLSTLFITLVSKSKEGGSSLGGVRKAFQRLGNQLKGPLGIILLFQAVIAALDFFSQKSRTAKKDTEEFTSEIEKQNEALREQIRINQQNLENTTKLVNLYTYEFSRALKDSRLFAKQNAGALKEIADRLEEVGIKGAKELTNQDISIQNRIFAAVKLTEILEKQIEIDKLRVQQNNALTSGEKDKAREIALQLADLQNQKTLLEDQFNRLVGINEVEVSNTGEKKKQVEKLKELNALELRGLEFYKVKNEGEEIISKIQSDRRAIEFQGIRTVLAEEIAALSKRGLLRDEFEKEKVALIIKAVEKEIDAIKLSLKLDKLSVQERLRLRERLGILITRLGELEKTQFEILLDQIAKVVKDMTNLFMDFNDAELSAAERNTVLLNNQLKERLKNEKLSAKERERINQQIEANEEKLQRKRDEIAKRNFRLQKAFAIAQTIINTASAVAEALPNIKKSVAVGILGAAQVATILATKFVPTASALPSGPAGIGVTGGAGTQDPTFNIVGTGQQFQLSQAIAQRTGEPVRAFVVTGDVRSGLALERNIIKGSKLG